ncbi:AbrB/MazE/SpoVT family DNA-binding domain-containing protein [Bacillus thuringiensis]
MKSTGILRKNDYLGQIVIPKETRRISNIHEKNH